MALTEKQENMLQFLIGRGTTGATNVELANQFHHRFGGTLYELKVEGYRFEVNGEGEGDGVVRYTYTGKVDANIKPDAITVLKQEMANAGGTISAKRLDKILQVHGLNVVYRPNKRNV